MGGAELDGFLDRKPHPRPFGCPFEPRRDPCRKGKHIITVRLHAPLGQPRRKPRGDGPAVTGVRAPQGLGEGFLEILLRALLAQRVAHGDQPVIAGVEEKPPDRIRLPSRDGRHEGDRMLGNPGPFEGGGHLLGGHGKGFPPGGGGR